MTDSDAKADLHDYLQGARDVLLWKLDGLSEYDVRRPFTPTGTNLLGLVKHSATAKLRYFGDVFGRPHGLPLTWLSDDAPANADMWATPDQSRAEIVALYRRAWQVTDAASTRWRWMWPGGAVTGPSWKKRPTPPCNGSATG